MPPKRRLAHLKENSKSIAKRRLHSRLACSQDENFLTFEDKSTEGSWVPEKEKLMHKDMMNEEDDSDSEEDVEITDDDGDMLDTDAFSKLLRAAQDSKNFDSLKIPFQRGPFFSTRQKKRHTQHQRQLALSAHGSRPLIAGFLIPKTPSAEADLHTSSSKSIIKRVSPQDERYQKQQAAIEDLKKLLSSKKVNLQGQDLARHRAVLSFLEVQIQKPDYLREEIAKLVAECYGRGSYVARKIITWEIQWMTNRTIEEGQQGCHTKSFSWFNDEGVQLAVRECISSSGDKLSAQKLAKAVGDYLNSQKAITTVEDTLQLDLNLDKDTQSLSVSQKIRVRTARRWLKKLGLSFDTVSKNVYIDGHEREDVVKYRQEEFLPLWASLERRMVVFSEDGTWTRPSGLEEEEKAVVLVTHDESIFSANDGKRRIWKEKGKSPLRPKGKGKGIMVSEFLIPVGRLHVPDSVPDTELLRDPNWPLDEHQKPRRYCTELLEYGKDNYWDGDKMTDQTVNLATRIFSYAYPNCQALFAFDNASNHACFAENALLAKKMNLGMGGKQPRMKDGFNDLIQQIQPMVFPDDHPNVSLRGQPKGLKQVLTERGLWGGRVPGSGNRSFLLECPTSQNRPGCDPSLNGDCCARAVMNKQPDFQGQRGRLQEEVEATGNLIIFYPKFHCELNFIERYFILFFPCL